MPIKDLMTISTVRKYLLEDPILDIYEKIFAERGYPQERRKELLDLTNAILDGVLPPKDAPAIIAEAFKIDEAAAKKLACDALGYDLLPLELFVPGIAEAIKELGGKIEDYPATRVGKEKIVVFSWAKELCAQTGVTFSDVLLKRLALLLEGRLKGEKTADGLRTFFERPLTIGGLALPKDKIDAMLLLIEAKVPFVEAVSEEELKKAQEIVVESQMSESHGLAVTVPVSPVHDRLREATEAVMDAARNIALEKNIPLEKFRSLVEKDLRGVRERDKTRDILEGEYKLSGADLRVILDALDLGKKRYEGEEYRQEEREEKEERGGEAEQGETQALDEKFAVLTKKAPEESVQPIMPGAQTSAARVGAPKRVPNAQAAKILKPKPAKAELTVGSVPPKGAERKVTDVVPAARLMGPVEQIANMSTVEFRRLSSDPAEAAQKVDDMLSALLATSYEEKVRGINAWRKGPLNQLYLSISEEALNSGLPIPDICSKRRKEGKDCLSPTEIKAIVSLNAKLRF